MKIIFSSISILALLVLMGFYTTVWADSMTGMAMATPAASSQPAGKTVPVHHKKTRKAKKKKNTKVVWVCPMGDYSGPRTKNGKCPHCGMELVKEVVPIGTPSASTGK